MTRVQELWECLLHRVCTGAGAAARRVSCIDALIMVWRWVMLFKWAVTCSEAQGLGDNEQTLVISIKEEALSELSRLAVSSTQPHAGLADFYCHASERIVELINMILWFSSFWAGKRLNKCRGRYECLWDALLWYEYKKKCSKKKAFIAASLPYNSH